MHPIRAKNSNSCRLVSLISTISHRFVKRGLETTEAWSNFFTRTCYPQPNSTGFRTST